MRLNKKSIIFGLIGLLSTGTGFLAKAFYRSYIYANQINDFGIADAAPSFFYVIGLSQLLLVRPAKYPFLVVLVVTIASVLFELMQYYKGQELDIQDILASLLGGGISMFIVYLVTKQNPLKN